MVRQYIIDICRSLIDAQELLDALDARVGDGDTGSTFATAARRLLDGVDDLPLNDTPALAAEALHAGQLAMQRDGSAPGGSDHARRPRTCHRRCAAAVERAPQRRLPPPVPPGPPTCQRPEPAAPPTYPPVTSIRFRAQGRPPSPSSSGP